MTANNVANNTNKKHKKLNSEGTTPSYNREFYEYDY
jgi:hypothetical protein